MADAYIGEIRLFAGNYAPQGWLFCNGQTLNISGNEALFSLIGTTYGGDGRTTFQLPNLQGVLALGRGQGPGLSNYQLGQTVGSYSVQLTQANVPGHTHSVATAVEAQQVAPANLAYAPCSWNAYVTTSAAGFAAQAMDPSVVSSAGSNQPHENRMPALVISYIICTNGIFPSSN
ncbi:MAG TPA: tail fiber protein [Polyangiales bacterium]